MREAAPKRLESQEGREKVSSFVDRVFRRKAGLLEKNNWAGEAVEELSPEDAGDVAVSDRPSCGQEGWLRHEQKDSHLIAADGVVDKPPLKKCVDGLTTTPAAPIRY
jgi:hypothetical protein